MPVKMRVDATNKLLKIIEEPPDNTLFILVTEQREHLLPTILSRTQLVKITVLNVEEIASALSLRFKTEPRAARRIAKLADGNLNLAFSLAGDGERDFSNEAEFMNWMRLCYSPFHEKDGKSSWTELNSWIERSAKGGRESLKQFFTFCLEAARECMLVNHGDQELVRFDDDVIPNFSRFTKFIHAGNIAEITDLLNKAHYAIERNANAKILLLDLSFKMNRLLNKGLNK